MNVRIAVYDYLKKIGARHEEFFGGGKAVFKGPHWMKDFLLKKEGAYPIAIAADDFEIFTEVYELDMSHLHKFDELYNIRSGWYERRHVITPYGGAFLYTLRVPKMRAEHDQWFPDGNWIGLATPLGTWLGWDREKDLRVQTDEVAFGMRRGTPSWQIRTGTDVMQAKVDAKRAVIPVIGLNHSPTCRCTTCRPWLMDSSKPTFDIDKAVDALAKAAVNIKPDPKPPEPTEPVVLTDREKCNLIRRCVSQFNHTMKVVEL